ncbi:MAG: hypothetical protein LBC59_08500 [Chitinispirillales bacterium]|jgi:hypothetical protein|nr:hypothetical protein [Chitinispirillales bacterium]
MPKDKDSAKIARQFLTLFNCSMLYGSGHPNTLKNAAAFAELVNGCMDGGDGHGMITVISHNGGIVIEDSPADRALNVTKLISQFERLALTSVSFERGISAESVAMFMELAGDGNIDAMERNKAALAEIARGAAKINGIRINYVQYGKISADEVVVKAADAGAKTVDAEAKAADTGVKTVDAGIKAADGDGASNLSTANLSRQAAAQIEQVLTLSALLKKPKEVSEALAQSDTQTISIDALQGAFGKIRGEIDSSKTHNVDELLESLHNLRTDLYEAIEVQKATGRMMRSAAVINKELSDLTAHAIVKLVRDEYASGKVPINRLAHTIRRMLPNNAELLGILPQMKEMLLADGMSLGDYLELVRALGLKVESESLSDSLREAADTVGATVSDLVAAIRAKPAEAASLILLASEVRQATGEGDSGLPEALSAYVEEVCSKLAVDKCGAAGGGGALKGVLAQLESQMYSQLSKRGVPKAVMAQVKERLNAGFGETLAGAGKALGGAFPTASAAPAPTPLSRPDDHHDHAKKDAAPQAKHGRRKVKMPAEALSSGNMLFLMNKEIKRNLRYKSPFSTLIVSIEKVATDGGEQRPLSPEDTEELLPQLFKHVQALLRDVDMIGTIGAEETAAPELFILLPMVGAEGTDTVKERIIKTAEEGGFERGGRKAAVEVKVSVTVPGENTKDLKSYLKAAKNNHTL